jgi:5'-nucleotidase
VSSATKDISPLFFGEYVLPDIVLTGPNVGPNLGHQTMMSGTVAAAAEAVKQGIPAIAFSGFDGVHRYVGFLKKKI